MRRVRCAVIGCGVIGPVHGAVLSALDTAELVACCDIIPERAQAFAERFGVPDWYTDASKIFERDDIDSVSICTPHYLHVPMTVDAARAGKHVMTEKPMAMNSQEATDAIMACREAGVKFAVCFQNRFNPATQQAKAAIEQGLLGDIVSIHGTCEWYRAPEYYDDSPWRGKWSTEGGGVLINQAIHTLDLVLYLGGKVSGVMASVGTLGHPTIEVEDVASIVLRYSSGAIGSFYATNCAYPSKDVSVDVIGTRGSITIEGQEIAAFETMDGAELPAIPVNGFSGSDAVGKAYYGSSHGLAIEDYIQAILEDRDPMITGEEGRKAIDVLSAIYRSNCKQAFAPVKAC